jgi:hypothetical protein
MFDLCRLLLMGIILIKEILQELLVNNFSSKDLLKYGMSNFV